MCGGGGDGGAKRQWRWWRKGGRPRSRLTKEVQPQEGLPAHRAHELRLHRVHQQLERVAPAVAVDILGPHQGSGGVCGSGEVPQGEGGT
jgi:hypothetical protein